MNLLKELACFLASNKSRITRTVPVLIERWSPTYGESSSVEHLDVIEFDRLVQTIDDFSKRFEE